MFQFLLCLFGKHVWTTNAEIDENGNFMKSPQWYFCRCCSFGWKVEFKKNINDK